MNLYLFPEAACLDGGYGIGVEFAYQKLKPNKEDIVVWYTDRERDVMLHVKDNDYIISKNRFFSLKSVSNILQGKDRTEMGLHELDFLKDMNFDSIHCDEVIFYRALRSIFPDKKFNLRLHNCFSRILDRQRMIGVQLDWKYQTKLKNMYKLERDIFRDKKVYKIFISDEDRNYYVSNFGISSDSETWAYIPDQNQIDINRNREVVLNHKLVWFGGIESHKAASIKWFIDEVLPGIKVSLPDVEFHLYGKNSERFDNPAVGVYGHGFYHGKGLPENQSLYVNPDIIGGGIKLKLMTLLENGMPVISSPFGYEGYSPKLIDDKFCIVEEQDSWVTKITEILNYKRHES